MSAAVLVVGASSGIGRAAALELSRRGDRLVLFARDRSSLKQVADDCLAAGADGAEVVAGDVLHGDDLQRAVEAAAAWGGLDAVVHTAAVMAYGALEEVPVAVTRQVVETATIGTLLTARAVLPGFRARGRGSLVFVNSLLGSVTVPLMGAYSTSKWAQRAVVRTLQQETRDVPGIGISLVSPGSINTPIYYSAANFMGRGARPPVPVMQPERVARTIAGLVDRPRRNASVPVGPINPVVIAGYRLLPGLFDLMVGPLFRLAGMTRQALAPHDGAVFEPRPELDRVHGHWPDR